MTDAVLAAGHVIGGRYRIEGFIGAGGMQNVYEAHDNLIGRRVALKTPKNRSAMTRFYRSAVLSARVNHPNVAKTLDYLSEGNDRFLIEELVVGGDLSVALLEKAKFLDPYLVARIFHHLAKGLAAAHHVDVIHRDLKPSNIMVMGGYSLEAVKITDFGIAKLAGEVIEEAVNGGAASITLSQTAVGALPYMAPEAIDAPKTVTSASDVWSLGAMIFELLVGEKPFGSGLRAVPKILAALPVVFPPFVTANPQFSPLASQIMRLIMHCLQRDPNQRPTADQLVAECQGLCYNASPRRIGRIRRIDYGSYGFISAPDEDVFFHMSSVYGPVLPKLGDEVVFASFIGGGSPRAHPLVKLL